MRIAIYGGAFDPPTLGHKYVIDHILDNNLADEVWIFPCNKHTFKKEMSRSDDRWKMCKIAFHNKDERVKLYKDCIELELPSSTFSLMEYTTREVKDSNIFYFIVGSDNIKDMYKWIDSEKLLAKYKFISIPRNPTFMSSTEIRESIKEGRNIIEHIDDKVFDYIRNNRLYGNINSIGQIIWKGKHLEMRTINEWEFVHRPQQVVSIIATTFDMGATGLILVRQWRKPVGEYVIELPSGLVDHGESPADAASRELLEETGYTSGLATSHYNNVFVKSAGLTDESVSYFRATNCKRKNKPEEGIAVKVTREPLMYLRTAITNGDKVSSDAYFVSKLFEEGAI